MEVNQMQIQMSKGYAEVKEILESANLSAEAKAFWSACQEAMDDEERFEEAFNDALKNPEEV